MAERADIADRINETMLVEPWGPSVRRGLPYRRDLLQCDGVPHAGKALRVQWHL